MPDVIERKRRWTICYLEAGASSCAAEGDADAWTHDLKTALMLADCTGDMVVDADWLAANWATVKETRSVPPEAMPEFRPPERTP